MESFYMLNKILIADPDKDDRKELEQILQEIVEEGGELFFADKKEEALTILKRERPQLLLLDADLMGGDPALWKVEGVHLILMCRKKDLAHTAEQVLHKPFKAHQVLEKCRAWLKEEPAAPIPPM